MYAVPINHLRQGAGARKDVWMYFIPAYSSFSTLHRQKTRGFDSLDNPTG